jgi:hypothetical protein
MPSRTYKEEEVGPQSTNRFVVPREIPTTVVTGAETKLASVQPNLTGKRKLPYQPDDIPEEPDVGKVNSLGEWITAIGGGLSLGMWLSETGLLGKGAQEASSSFLKSSAENINSLLGTQTGPLRDINPARDKSGKTPHQQRQDKRASRKRAVLLVPEVVRSEKQSQQEKTLGFSQDIIDTLNIKSGTQNEQDDNINDVDNMSVDTPSATI